MRCLKEKSHRNGSFEHTQRMLLLRNKTLTRLLLTLNLRLREGKSIV